MMMIRKLAAMPPVLALIAAAAAAPSSAVNAADAAETHAAILDAARGFLEQQLEGRPGNSEIRLGSLDRRLRLARCDGPLEGYLPPGAKLTGNTSVGVRCNGSGPWKVYIPARIALIEKVVVASGFLARGTRIGPEHVDVAERDVSAAGHGYLSDPQQAVGMIVKQPVQNGLILTPALLDKPKLIRRGEEVVIVSRSGNFEVRSAGSALTDGSEGDRIRVRNSKSKRIIEGRVTAQGDVMVQL